MKSARTEAMKKIRDEVWNLTTSPLYEYRKSNKYYPVLGEGSHEAKFVFIGEAPGKNEAETGRPFCGAAGRVLDNLLNSIALKRAEVYVTNIVKDRPPENRDPTTEEISLYSPFLIRQLGIIKPKVIVTLGRYSMDFIMRQFELESVLGPISKIHGGEFTAKTSWGETVIIPLYHPAVATYNPHQMETLAADFKILTKYL